MRSQLIQSATVEPFVGGELQRFVDLSPIAMIQSDGPDGIFTANRAAIDILAPVLRGTHVRSLSDILDRVAPELNVLIDAFRGPNGVICREHRIEAATTIKPPDRFIEVTITKLRPDLFTTVLIDRTEAVLHQRELYRRSERMRAVVECVPNSGIFTLDRNGRIDGWNRSAERLSGLAPHHVIGLSFGGLLAQVGVVEQRESEILAQARRDGWSEVECWVQPRAGSRFWCNSLITALRTVEGEFDGFSIVARDMTERRASERELKRLAETDPLTDVYNRRSFLDLAATSLQSAVDCGASCGFAMLDIDHFKGLNDAFGHAAGDAALKEFVGCIRLGLRKSDLFGRIGGEEFGVFLRDVDPASAAALLERIRMSVEALEVRFNGNRLKLTVSIGFAAVNAEREPLDQVMSRADDALYKAKGAGRNRVALLP
ncbi:MAG: sensor domain-containing diguanylate cyclase [Pseudomonadota bacterium]